MKTPLLILLYFTILATMSCENEKSGPSMLEGKIEGRNTEYLVVQYTDSLGKFVSDTLNIKGNTFAIENPLNSPQKVALTSNLTGKYMEDPNRLIFFLEPGNINLHLKEGQFAQTKITGSKTQLEYENLEETTKPFFEEIEDLSQQRQDLVNSKQNGSGKDIDRQIDSLNSRWLKALNIFEKAKLTYAFKNPHSYVSADIISFYRKKLSRDSLEIFYKNFPPAIKQSLYGKNIKEQIDLYVINSGDKAPNFTGKNLQGEKISLEQFTGKVVLLDFMAGWCIPCIKNHPQLKKIYNTYNSQGLEIISISFDKDEEKWKNNVLKENLNWHHIYEGLDTIGKEGTISKLYTVQPIPAYILINENGIIINRYAGADKMNKSLDDLENDLNDIYSVRKALVNNE